MRISDILTEAYVDSEITKSLKDRGYKFLGKGADQVVFLEPDTGYILKIFGTSKGKSGSSTELTNAQKAFKTFYDLTKADPENKFLPEIVGYEPFMWEGRPYLQIRMERLFEFNKPSVRYWNDALSDMASAIEYSKTFDEYFDEVFDNELTTPQDKKRNKILEQLIMHIGKDGLKKLWDTMVLFNKVAKKNGYVYDLHSGNFMLSSDGTPVISDPFFMGWNRST